MDEISQQRTGGRFSMARAAASLAQKGEFAVMVHSRHPLMAPRPVAVRPFTPVRDLAPPVRGNLMLKINGEWILRRQWGYIVQPGNVIEWHEVPQGGNTSRTILTIVLVVVSLWVPGALGLSGWQAAATTLAINVVGSAIINALVPLQQPALGGALASPGSVYNAATSGNQARLGQPIPVIYGRHRIFPDYASQPYIEYRDNDQYFHAFYCVGQGRFNIPLSSLFIDDTLLSHFTDVWFAILPPGEQPTRVHANVVTAPEVAGQEIKSVTYSPGFAACGPRQKAFQIGVDVLFDRLGIAGDDGGMGDKSVPVRFEAREIDDFGVATSAWFLIGAETFTAATTTPQRFSVKYTLPTPARVEIRCVRIDAHDDNSRVFNDPMWGGLRAYLSTPAALCPTATHFELVIRASEQLSGLSQRKINMIPRRMLRTWHPETGWGDEVETRSIAWALADAWSNTVYGDGLPDNRIDLQTLYELDQVWASRQDRLDIVFDSRVTSWDAAKTIAQAGRATPFRRMGVNTLVRDSAQDLPVTAFTSRNMLPGASIGYALPTEQTADGVIVEYFDNRAWDWQEIDCPAPGRTVRSLDDPRYDESMPSMSNAARLRIPGITGPKHAEREGLYQAAQNLYRRKFPSWTTELQGLLPSFGSLVLCAPPMAALVQAGDVAAWDEDTLTMELTEPVSFEPGKSYSIALLRDDGSVTPTITVNPGPSDREVILAAVPDFDLICDDPNRERPKYCLGTSQGHRVLTKVLGIRKMGRGSDGSRTIEMSGVVEDPRVHAADAHLLPGPGQIQDPVDSGVGVVDDSIGGFLALVNLSDHELFVAPRAGFELRNSGKAALIGDVITDLLPGEWISNGVLETSQAATFEARATVLSAIYSTIDENDTWIADPTILTGSATDTWVNLGTSREWFSDLTSRTGNARADLLVEIRSLSDGIVQTAHRIVLRTSNS